jgi:hypothetical protein
MPPLPILDRKEKRFYDVSRPRKSREEELLLRSRIETYEEGCQAITQWGMVPLSSWIPQHPSLEALTRPEAWHTGSQNDPWLWRDRLPAEGVAAYGRFLAGKPLLVARALFPLVKCLLSPASSLEERYAAGLLARSTVRVYEVVRQQDGIDARELRRVAGMQGRAEKQAFDRALIDLQSTADILICGTSGRLNAHGQKSGWNSACYMLTDHWMASHGIVPLSLSRENAHAQLVAWLESRWAAEAVRYVLGKMKETGVE